MKKNKKQVIDNHKCIVLCTDHYTPLGIIRSLGEIAIYPIVILVADNPHLINYSRYISILHIVDTIDAGYKLLQTKYGNEKEKPFLFMAGDKIVSFIDTYYDEIVDKFITYNSNNESGRLNWLMNKDNITDLALMSGLDVPLKEVVNTGFLPQKLKYPVITKVLKSTLGAWKNDVHICSNEKELLEAYKTIQSPQLIIQEYIQKKGEFCYEGFSINNGNDIYIPFLFEYIRYYNNSYGHYMTVTPVIWDLLMEKIHNLFKLTKYNGIFEIEFMKGPNDENFFLEINLRPSTWNYATTVGGCNLPYLWAKSTLLGKIPYDSIKLKNSVFTAMVEPADFIRNAKKIGYYKWIKQCINSSCHYYFNKKDPKPFFSYLINRIIKKNAE